MKPHNHLHDTVLSLCLQLGREEPAMSMDVNGKIIWAKHSEVQQANIKALSDQDIKDGERLPLAVKDMGSCEIYPQTIQHNPNGRWVWWRCQINNKKKDNGCYIIIEPLKEYGGKCLLGFVYIVLVFSICEIIAKWQKKRENFDYFFLFH